MADDSWTSVITPFKPNSLDGNDCQQRSIMYNRFVVAARLRRAHLLEYSDDVKDRWLFHRMRLPLYDGFLSILRQFCLDLKKKINLFCFNLMVSYERIFTRFEYARFEIMTNSAVNVLAMGRENARINPSCKRSATNVPSFSRKDSLKTN